MEPGAGIGAERDKSIPRRKPSPKWKKPFPSPDRDVEKSPKRRKKHG